MLENALASFAHLERYMVRGTRGKRRSKSRHAVARGHDFLEAAVFALIFAPFVLPAHLKKIGVEPEKRRRCLSFVD